MPHRAALSSGMIMTSQADTGIETDQGKGRAMTNQYEWIDSHDNPRTEYASGDILFGWVAYVTAVVYLIV